MIEEIGAIEAIVSGISTLKDGSCKVIFELNPDNHIVINRLMTRYLNNQRVFVLGITQGVLNKAESDEVG